MFQMNNDWAVLRYALKVVCGFVLGDDRSGRFFNDSKSATRYDDP
jgi:hypothetical protein